MPRVHHVKARKDYPGSGIKKGEMYYTADVKTGPRSGHTVRSKTPLKRWMLTGSSFNSTIWQIEDEGFDNITSPEDLNDVAQQIREAGEQARESFDNMPEGLQQGDTGQLLEQRSDDCESWADEIEEAASTLEEKLSEIEKMVEAKAEWDEHRKAVEELEQDEAATDAQMDALTEQEPQSEDPGEDWDVEEARREALEEAVQAAQDGNPGSF